MATRATSPEVRPGAAAGPVPAGERIEVVDILRGFALFGILVVNMASFKSAAGIPGLGPEAGGVDRLASLGILLFAQSKFFTLFSFLFGYGFSIQLLRARERGVSFVPRFARRLLVLLGFGLAHAVLLWNGDILTLYAVAGFVLILFRDRSPRALLVWAGALLLGALLLFLGALGALELYRATAGGAARVAGLEASFLEGFAQVRAEELRLYGGGGYAEIVAGRAKGLPGTWAFLLLISPTVLAMFLLGLWAGKRGVLRDVEDHLPLLRRVRFWGLGIGLPLNMAVAAAQAQLGPISGLLVLGVDLALAGPVLSMGYAAALVLLARRAGWGGRLAPLAATGRMALTNYLLQSLICTTLFYRYGFGLYGEVGPAAGLLPCVGIYALQIPLSAWWLGRYRFGPLEWVWRSLTYGR